jgi:molybdate transport system substrate-binding protein
MADLRILSAGAVKRGVAQTAEAFAREHGHRVKIDFATAPELSARIEAGAQADVIIAPPAVMDAFIRMGRVIADSRRFVGRSRMGVVVHHRSPVTAVPDVQSLERVLSEAAVVVHNKASSGIYAAKLIEKLGLAQRLVSRIVVVGTGSAVMEYVAEHPPATVGLAQISEIRVLIDKGLPIRLAGPLPDAVQNVTSYEAAAVAGQGDVATARALASYLTTPDARAVFVSTGID